MASSAPPQSQGSQSISLSRLGPAPPHRAGNSEAVSRLSYVEIGSSMSNCRLLMMPSASPTLLARVTSKPLCVKIMPNVSRIALSSSTTRIVGRLPLVVILLQIGSLPADPVKLHQGLAMQFQRDVFEPESWFDQPLLHIRDFCRAPKQRRGSVPLCWRCQVSRKSETDGS